MNPPNIVNHGTGARGVPRWAAYKQASAYSGLSIRLLQDYVSHAFIRSSVVLEPGAKRGVRLIDLHSLDAFIEQEINRPPTELATSRDRKIQCLGSGDWHAPHELIDGLCRECREQPLEFHRPS